MEGGAIIRTYPDGWVWINKELKENIMIGKRLIGLKDLQNVISLKHSKIYELIKEDPKFPKPIKIGKKTVFDINEVFGWVESLKAARV